MYNLEKEEQQYNKDNIFARIIRGEIPCSKVFEDDAILAFHDIYPMAMTHILVIPKAEYVSFNDFVLCSTAEELQHFFCVVQKVASMFGLHETGYRVVSNHGSDAVQTIRHFHVHILGGERLGKIATKNDQ